MKKITNTAVTEKSAEGIPKRPSRSQRKTMNDNAADSHIPSPNPSELSVESPAAGKKPLTNQDAQNQITNSGETVNQTDKIEN